MKLSLEDPTLDAILSDILAKAFMEGVEWERNANRIDGKTFAEQLALVGNGCMNYPNFQKIIAETVQNEGTQKKAAERLGISPQYLNDILRGRREISDAVARKYGLRRVVIFERIPE